MNRTGEPSFGYMDTNPSNFFSSNKSLGNATQSSLGRFSDPAGMRATGKRFVAFSILTSNDDPVDYDKDYFVSEKDANSWIKVLKSGDFHNTRVGVVCPVEDEAEVETKLINQIDTGVPSEELNHGGALPNSWGNMDTQGPFYV